MAGTTHRLISFILLMCCACPAGAVSRYDHIAQASIDTNELSGYVGFIPKDTTQAMRPPMNAATSYFIALNLFAEHDQTKRADSPFFDARSWHDFQIFPDLLQSIDRTHTLFGKATLAGMLIEDRPLTDKVALERRQAIIKTLRAQPELLQSVGQVLAEFKKIEPFFLAAFSGQSSSRQQLLSRYCLPRASADAKSLQWLNNTFDTLEKQPGMHLYMGLSMRLGILLGVVGLYGTAESLWKWAVQERLGADSDHAQAVGQDVANARQGFSTAQTLAMASGATWAVWHGLRFLESWTSNTNKLIQLPLDATITVPTQIRDLFTTHRILQEDFAQLGAVLEHLRPIAHQLREAGLVALVPECKDFFALCEEPEKFSKDMNSLVTMLNTATFKGKYSIFTHFGRLFAANHLMRMTISSWSQVLQAVGYLDAYVSLATLMKDYEGSELTFCYPEYVERATPYVEMSAFWHPIVGADGVSNDLAFGAPEQNIILTGPFAAGKSTIMRGLGICVLMAQNLGIAPARSMKFTPFVMINTSMNVSDNLANNLSGHMAELYLAGKLAKKITETVGFSLNIFDELFRATSDADAEKTLYRFAKKVAVPGALNIIATHKHTDKIIGLEQEYAAQKSFANYKVESPDGIKPDYKLKRGWTRQSLLHENTLARFGLA